MTIDSVQGFWEMAIEASFKPVTIHVHLSCHLDLEYMQYSTNTTVNQIYQSFLSGFGSIEELALY